MKRILAALVLLGIAFGYVEAAVVVYLRDLVEPIHQRLHPDHNPANLFPILTADQLEASAPRAHAWLKIEMGREAATIAMLIGIGLAVGHNWRQVLAGFAIAFGLWDIFFYVWLKILLNWPVSILDWDLLFLLPVPWAAPVLAPVIVSATLVLGGLLVLHGDLAGRPILAGWDDWLLIFPGAAVIVLSFCWDFQSIMAGQEPVPFGWSLFGVGEAMGVIGLLHAWWRSRSPAIVPGRRAVMPRLILGAAALAASLLITWPAPDWEPMYRNSGLLILGMAVPTFLLLWVLLLSGYRWTMRLAIIVAAAAALGGLKASVRAVHFTGDFKPIFEFRWAPSHDDVVASSRSDRNARIARPLVPETPVDFLGYFGRDRNGIVPGTALANDWKQKPPVLRWRQPVGGGYSGFAIRGDLAVTLEQRQDQEAIVAYDLATGNERWLHSYPAHFKESLGGDGPRSTPTIFEDAVYALGVLGRLMCLSAATGEPRWSADILENNDNIHWGMSGSPLIHGNLVIVSPGAQRSTGHTLVAFDRNTGKTAWSSGNHRAGYSSPMLVTLANQKQILLFDGQGIGSYEPSDGRELWWHPWVTNEGINVAQPVVIGPNHVFISSGYGVGCACLEAVPAAERWQVKVAWQNKLMRCRFTSPVEYDGFLYGLDEGMLVCLNARTGDRKWKEGHYGHGQLLRQGNRVLILSETGQLVLVQATPLGHRVLGMVSALEGKTWNPPAIRGEDVMVRNHREMACFRLEP